MVRAMNSRDPRYARILGSLGYQTTDLAAETKKPEPKPEPKPKAEAKPKAKAQPKPKAEPKANKSVEKDVQKPQEGAGDTKDKAES